MVMSQPGLSLVAEEYRHAVRFIPSRSCPWPEPIGICNDDCSISWQLGIPCRHTLHNKLETGTSLTKWDVHPRWHLRQPTSRNPYRRILDPKIATNLRGRPKNAAQHIPDNMEIKRPAIPCSEDGTPASKTSITAGTARRTAALGPGKQTGMRQAGRRRQPNVRRLRSEWEIICDDDPVAPTKRTRRCPRKKPTTATSSAATSLGDETECEDCINVRL